MKNDRLLRSLVLALSLLALPALVGSSVARSDEGDAGAKPEDAPKPEDKPKPEDTPKPEDKPKPEDAPKPEDTPKPEAKPKPEDAAKPAAPISKEGMRWTLTFEHGPLRFVHCKGVTGAPACYEYMRLKVTNPTDLPRPWNPFAEAITDTNKTYVAVGKSSALLSIRAAEKDDTIQALEGSGGKIEPGETKNLVAVFGELDPNWDKLEVRVHGLVNPITTYKFEIYGEGNEVIVDAAYRARNQKILQRIEASAKEAGGSVPNPEVVYREVREQRVRSIAFQRIGDEFGREADAVTQIAEDWKVIGEPNKLRDVKK